jgi:two-component system, cell cycle sensor histidine kinase and response regulator CckA
VCTRNLHGQTVDRDRRGGRIEPSRPSTPTVLVAEDDPVVRATLVRALEHIGFAVLSAADGHEALAAAAAFAEPLRLLVTDVDLPGLTGGELARVLGAARPETPVLFVSGRPAPRDLSEAVVGRPSAFLAKPLTFDRLRDAVAELAGPLRAPRESTATDQRHATR